MYMISYVHNSGKVLVNIFKKLIKFWFQWYHFGSKLHYYLETNLNLNVSFLKKIYYNTISTYFFKKITRK